MVGGMKSTAPISAPSTMIQRRVSPARLISAIAAAYGTNAIRIV